MEDEVPFYIDPYGIICCQVFTSTPGKHNIYYRNITVENMCKETQESVEKGIHLAGNSDHSKPQ
jgi:hypothetical protein